MDNNNKRSHFRMVVLITTPKLTDKAADIFKKGSLPVQYRLSGEGTASSEVMDLLGLGSIDKGILVSMVPKVTADDILRKLHTELKLDTINSGIAFTLPLTGSTKFALRIMQSLSDNQDSERKEDVTVAEYKHALIAAIVNRGFSNNVMDAARQEEKEMVLILAAAEDKVKIMSAISEKCGMHSDAKGFVLSLPIDSVMGI